MTGTLNLGDSAVHTSAKAIDLKVGNGNKWPIIGMERIRGGEGTGESRTCDQTLLLKMLHYLSFLSLKPGTVEDLSSF